jgi:hypothetical protein
MKSAATKLRDADPQAGPIIAALVEQAQDVRVDDVTTPISQPEVDETAFDAASAEQLGLQVRDGRSGGVAQVGLGERGDVDIDALEATPEAQERIALVEEQQRILDEANAEALAAENANMLARREQAAQDMWSQHFPDLDYGTLSPQQREIWEDFIAGVEELSDADRAATMERAIPKVRKEVTGATQPTERASTADRGDTAGREEAVSERPEEGGSVQTSGRAQEDNAGSGARAAPRITVRKRRRITRPGESLDETSVGTSRDAFETIVKNVLGRRSNWRLHVYDTPEAAIEDGVSPEALGGSSGRGAFGWVETRNGIRHATFILSRVAVGREMGAFFHEVGAHIGLESALTPQTLSRMARQIRQWAGSSSDSVEATAAKAALARVGAAQTPADQLNRELLAYFVEEAVNGGVNPTAMQQSSAIARFFRQLWTAIKRALGRSNVKTDAMSAQDFVDLAYGLARVEMNMPDPVPTDDTGAIQFGEPSFSSASADIARANIERMPDSVRNAVDYLWTAAKNAARNVQYGLSYTHDLADFVSRTVEPLKADVKRFMQAVNAIKVEQSRREQRLSAIVDKFNGIKDKRTRDMVQSYLFDSRDAQAWGYQPDWRGPVDIDADYQARFNNLRDADAQQVIRDVNRLMHDNLQDKQRLINERITKTFDDRIAATTDADEQAQLATERDAALKKLAKELVEIDGPYAPYKRHGTYVVQGMSAEMDQARLDNDTKRIEELRTDPAHYQLEFADSLFEAKKRQRELAETFGENASYWEKAEWRDNTVVGLPEVDRLRSLIAGMDANDSAEARRNKQLLNMAEDLALRVMSESHARQSSQHAKKIPGADRDMMRSFVAQGRADAHYIANLMHLSESNDAMTSITRIVEDPATRSQTDVSRADMTKMANALYWHHGKNLNYVETPMQDRLAVVSSAWYLLFSPAYYLQNLSQVAMMSVPYMAGRHGYAKTIAATIQAYKDIKDMVVSAGKFEHYDTSKVPDDVKHVIQALEDSGAINITMDLELGRIADTSDSALGQASRKFDQTVRRLPAKVETINRVVTGIAAYRLLKADGARSDEHAINYARKVINKTHGDYSDTPKWISPKFIPGAKVLFQFRKFQLIQIAYMARLLNSSMAGASVEEREMARRALLFTLSHYGALAGGLGLPGMGFIQSVVGLLGGMFGDENEPWDPDSQILGLREAADSLGFAPEVTDILLNGLPAIFDVNVTSKLGAQNALSLLPYTRTDTRQMGDYEKLVTAALGPSAGLGSKLWNATGNFQRGDYYRMLEQGLPTGIGDAVQAYRMWAVGERAFNGDITVTPEEMDLWDFVQAGTGFAPADKQKRFEATRQLRAFETRFSQRTSDLKREYVSAHRDKDQARKRELAAEWRELQQAKREAGFRASPLSELRGAPADARRRERNTEGGVQFDRGNRRFVRRQAELLGQPST